MCTVSGQIRAKVSARKLSFFDLLGFTTAVLKHGNGVVQDRVGFPSCGVLNGGGILTFGTGLGSREGRYGQSQGKESLEKKASEHRGVTGRLSDGMEGEIVPARKLQFG